ncbi:MAG: protein translocase subunit secE/sec61 gamma [Glomeribacter sp. 1016415]|nr:preprotein translocase subunit SecE [Mycoavidus cysteinexigens]MCX8565893.1 protein translocase subunit secE/sec61 gamma [Glomeribacter sp. 1016415]
MANPSVDNVNPAQSKWMLALAVLLAVAGGAAFYFYGNQPWYIRGALLLSGLVMGSVVALFSSAGKNFIGFTKEAWREIRKVVWPTRKEAGQTTLIVFVFVLLMAVYLWIGDKIIEWAVFSLILGWK